MLLKNVFCTYNKSRSLHIQIEKDGQLIYNGALHGGVDFEHCITRYSDCEIEQAEIVPPVILKITLKTRPGQYCCYFCEVGTGVAKIIPVYIPDGNDMPKNKILLLCNDCKKQLSNVLID